MDLFSLEGKVALVTGPGKGLGKTMAFALAQAGADIVGIGRGSMETISKEVQALGRRMHCIEFDLLNTDDIPKVAQEAINAFGSVDILLNNAGITPIEVAEDYKESDFDRAMNLNVKALFILTQEIGKHMISKRAGKIINICSIQSIIGGNNVSAYVASKHAVAGITKSFGNEWGKYNINVNGIAPGFMVTDNTKELRESKDLTEMIDRRIPMQRWGEPEDLMGTVVFLASNASNYITGQLVVVDGGYLNN